jgi:hypothetical protein
MNEKTNIKKIISERKNQYVKIIKRTPHLWKWVLEISENFFPNNNESESAKLYLALNPETKLICPYGNKKVFREFRNGFVCSKKCKCITDKTENTNLKIYGCKNVFQNENIKIKSKQTLMTKRGVYHNSQLLNSVNKKHWTQEILYILNDKEKFEKMLSECGMSLMAKTINVSESTIKNYHTKYNLNIIGNHISSFENIFNTWLSSLPIVFIKRDRKTLYPRELDYHFPNNKIALECQGDYWHMNPTKYNKTDIHPTSKKFAYEIWQRDLQKKHDCNKLNIELIQVWESDWRNDPNSIKQMILQKLRII